MKTPRLTLLLIIVFGLAALVSPVIAQIEDPNTWLIEWSPAGNYIAIVDGFTLAILSPELEKVSVLHETPYSSNLSWLQFYTISWSPDDRYLAASFRENAYGISADEMNYIVIWESTTWDEVLRLDNQMAFAIAWSPDSQFFSNSETTFETTTGEIRGTIPRTHLGVPSTGAWSPTDDILVRGGSWVFLDPFTYERLTDNLFDGVTDFQPAFSPDGSHVAIVAADTDWRIDIINVATFQVERSISLPSEPLLVDSLTWLTTNELAVNLVADTSTVIIDPTVDVSPVLLEIPDAVDAWSPDGRRYTQFHRSLDDSHLVYSQIDRETGGTVAQIAIGETLATNRFEIFDHTTNSTITALTSGDVLDIDTMPANAVIHAKMSPETVGSVIFDLNGTQTIDNIAPYTIPVPPVGTYTLTATPYTEIDGQGEAGAPLTVNFTVVE